MVQPQRHAGSSPQEKDPEPLPQAFALSGKERQHFLSKQSSVVEVLNAKDQILEFARKACGAQVDPQSSLIPTVLRKQMHSPVKPVAEFMIIDQKRFEAGELAQCSLASVLLVPAPHKPELIVPLVFIHSGTKVLGERIKKAVDKAFVAEHGVTPKELLEIEDRRRHSIIGDRLRGLGAVAVVSFAALLAGKMTYDEHIKVRIDTPARENSIDQIRAAVELLRSGTIEPQFVLRDLTVQHRTALLYEIEHGSKERVFESLDLLTYLVKATRELGWLSERTHAFALDKPVDSVLLNAVKTTHDPEIRNRAAEVRKELGFFHP